MMRSLVQWFCFNPIAAKLLMILLISMGIASMAGVVREVLPKVVPNIIEIEVEYPGASSEEVETDVVIPIENVLRRLEGIKNIQADANEGGALIKCEINRVNELSSVLANVESQVASIATFPNAIEKPVIRIGQTDDEIMTVAVWGDVSESALKSYVKSMEKKILALGSVGRVNLDAIRRDEISIEVNTLDLLKYSTSIEDVAEAIRAHSIDSPAGSINTANGDVKIGAQSKVFEAEDFKNIVVGHGHLGGQLKLDDVAEISNGFVDENLISVMNGEYAAYLKIFLASGADVIDASNEVKELLQSLEPNLPAAIKVSLIEDESKAFMVRMDVLITNAIGGLVLVLAVLFLFLNTKIAIWTSLGIAITFISSFTLLSQFEVSLNMVSIFAFILVIGIVVDDAIVVGENIHRFNSSSIFGNKGAAFGASDVCEPVIVSIISTIIFFLPILGLDGEMGDILKPIVLVVIACLGVSLVESLFILPSHLSVNRGGDKYSSWARRVLKPIFSLKESIERYLQYFILHRYRPFLFYAIKNSSAAILFFLMLLMVFVSVVVGGWVRQSFLPVVPADSIDVSIKIPSGEPFSLLKSIMQQVENGGSAVAADQELIGLNNGEPFIENFTLWGGANEIEATLYLKPLSGNGLTADVISQRWSELIGDIPQATEYSVQNAFNNVEEDIVLHLSAESEEDAEATGKLIRWVKAQLQDIPGVYNIRDTAASERNRISIKLKPYASTLGVDMRLIATQIRQSFYGEEVQRFVGNGEEVKVMVRLSKKERQTLQTLETFKVRSRSGVEVPLEEVAELKYIPGFSSLRRTDGKRNYKISANVNEELVDSDDVVDTILDRFNNQEAQNSYYQLREAGSSDTEHNLILRLLEGFCLSAFVIYTLLAVTFRSYVQPMVILSAIPFGFVGAVIGHMLFGLEISLLSILGFFACSGVVVNANLVLIDQVNKRREKGMGRLEAIEVACRTRFRAIFLTSLTTFIGLLPIIFESRPEALFLTPMAVSLGFGVVFSSLVSLILVPVLVYRWMPQQASAPEPILSASPQ